MNSLDLTKPLPGHAPLDGLIAEYAGATPSYVEESGSRWRVFFANLFPEAKGETDGATIPIRGRSAN